MWDFTCSCIPGHPKYDKGNYSVLAASLAFWLLLSSAQHGLPLKNRTLILMLSVFQAYNLLLRSLSLGQD